MGNIRCALNPKTIALIGATEDEESPGRVAFENLLRSKGRKVFPVNPHRETVFGLPCYPDITKVPEHIDLGVIVTSLGAVPRIVEECGIAGVEGVVILSAGFREAGEEGKRLESEIVETRKRYGMRIIGTDSLGVIRPNIGLHATFLKDLPDRGNIAFISQTSFHVDDDASCVRVLSEKIYQITEIDINHRPDGCKEAEPYMHPGSPIEKSPPKTATL